MSYYYLTDMNLCKLVNVYRCYTVTEKKEEVTTLRDV